MEEGSLRCDGNVSLRRRGEAEFGVKTELKNMNSFKNLHDGLAYEICRQAEVLEEGGGASFRRRGHWDPSAKRTIVMRTKETADDYRLFPEPDLAPYNLSEEFVERVRAKLPELPDARGGALRSATSGSRPTTRATSWRAPRWRRFSRRAWTRRPPRRARLRSRWRTCSSTT